MTFWSGLILSFYIAQAVSAVFLVRLIEDLIGLYQFVGLTFQLADKYSDSCLGLVDHSFGQAHLFTLIDEYSGHSFL